MPVMLKASIDGIADYVGCDDSAFSCLFPTGFDEIRKPGEIVVRIEGDDMTWQPIETAPKDGRSVLIFVAGEVSLAHYSGSHWYDDEG